MSDEEDELECRVCRGPAEEGHQLFKPCKCSGSIGWCHQDCLVSWLEIKHSRRCELCQYSFQFSPQYLENAPDQLSPYETLLGFSGQVLKAVPVVVRTMVAVSLWIIVAPLLTSYLYHGWMARSATIWSRFQQNKLQDIIAGIILIGIIIVSFLSLMSFLDFLRVEWERPANQHRFHNHEAAAVEAPVLDQIWADDDDFSTEDENYEQDSAFESNDEGEEDVSWDEFEDDVEESDDTESDDDDDPFIPPALGNNNFAAPPPLQPFDGGIEGAEVVDINIALDELLGLHAPLVNVMRNLLWLIAFNAGYLCFFAFGPRTIGVALSKKLFQTYFTAVSNTTNHTEFVLNETDVTVSNLWNAIAAESIRRETPFRLHDTCVILLGYLFLAFCVVFVQRLRHMLQRIRNLGNHGGNNENENRAAIGEMNRLVQGLNNDEDFANIDFGAAVGGVLDALTAAMKVGLLLFVKMFMLPIVLGIALDVSTATLLGNSIHHFVEYAGRDIFSFILFHWVAGITFMLLVTVSVLQLREVTHPDLLAQMIRPQEPQPDLLGNLLHDSVSAHAKRMTLSLLIYAFLLTLHVYIPVRFGITRHVSDHLQLKVAYLFTPQLQIPLELMFFHLCMLGLLERYKNGLGGMQHRWLKLMGGVLGISDRLLPHEVHSFECVGSRKLFTKPKHVDQLWKDLSGRNKDPVSILEAKLHMLEPFCVSSRLTNGTTNNRGERVVEHAEFIALSGPNMRSIRIPTHIGQYRLERQGHPHSLSTVRIAVWKEVCGKPISRPPEGWDDLAAGGADVQGRWAWNKEKKSAIEYGVAKRKHFFPKGQSICESLLMFMKLVTLAVLSWLASSTILCLVVAVPLSIGRMLFAVLRVPEHWIHDPFGYGVGFVLAFPMVRKLSLFLTKSQHSLVRRFVNWLHGFHLPSRSKSLILLWALAGYFVLAPLLLGWCYQLAIEPTAFNFERRNSWCIGTVLLHGWSQLCIIGILTKQFRVFVIEGLQLDTNDEETWQGRHGYIGKFFEKLHKIRYWEWDQIDRVALIDNVIRPVCMNLLALIQVPYWAGRLLSDFQLEHFKSLGVRLVLCFVGMVELTILYRKEIKACVRAIHRVARDDRYLVGEVLINHPGE